MDTLEKTLETVKKHLPAPGTELLGFAFLPPEALWTGTSNGRPFVAVAEDRWPFCGGLFLLATMEGPVFVADLENYNQCSYCAASFPQFMEITKLFLETVNAVTSPSTFDGGFLARCEEAEQVLRKKIAQIDASAIADEEGFWSTTVEELGYGI